MTLRRSSWIVCGLVLTLLVGAPSTSIAQDKALAESLFQTGKRLMEEKRYAEACSALAESQKEDPSPGTLLNHARCLELTGKPATAFAEYREAASLARARNRPEQEKASREAAAAIEPRISKLRIDAPPIPGLVVRRGETTLRPGALGVAVAIDPGTYAIEATAPGRRSWRSSITIADNADMKSIQVPALEPAPVASNAKSASAARGSEPDANRGTPSKVPAFVAFGVGAAGFAIGGIFGAMALSQESAVRDRCVDSKCPTADEAEADSVTTKAWVSNIGFGVGIAGAAVGVVLLVTSKGGSARAGASASHQRVVATPNGIAFRF